MNNSTIKGYKVFNSDWTCRGFQYEVGHSYEMEDAPKVCEKGFHFCLKASDCFNFYGFDSDNRVAEIEAYGEIDARDDESKYCTNKIRIVREIPWDEVLRIVNEGKDCTGLWNTGDRNTGDWNKSSFNNGCFMTSIPKIMLFNKPSDWTYEMWLNSKARCLLNRIPEKVVEWVWQSEMTDDEKAQHPEYKTTEGYLKILDETDCAQTWWDGLSAEDKQKIMSIPNFDKDIFEEITGIKI